MSRHEIKLNVDTIDPKTLEMLKKATHAREEMKPYFHDLIRLLEENDIKYFVDAGTLLGAVRDGREILWDDDYDIFMMNEEVKKTSKLFSTRPERQVNGKRITYIVRQKPPRNAFAQIGVMDLETKERLGGSVIDMFYMTDTSGFQKPRARDIYPIRRFRLGDIEVNVMNNYMEYLSRTFGKNWNSEYLIINHAMDEEGYRIENNHKYRRLNREQYIIMCESFDNNYMKEIVDKYKQIPAKQEPAKQEPAKQEPATERERENIVLNIEPIYIECKSAE